MGTVDGLLLGLIGLGSLAVTVGGLRLFPRAFANHSVLAVDALVVAAAVGAIFAPGAPTGLAVWDAVLRAALAAGVTLAATKARRWAWIGAAALAALGSSGGGLTWLALIALGLGVGSAIAGRRRTTRGSQGLVIGALIGAATVQVLLRLHLSSPSYASAAIAAGGCAVLVFSGLRQTRRRVRRRVLGLAAGLGCLIVVALGLFVVSVLQARGPAQQGLSLANAGLAQARAGGVTQAGTDLQAAELDFKVASRTLDAWWAWPTRLVPVAAQNSAALRVLARQGEAVARPAVSLARSGHGSYLRSSNGAIDTAHLVALGDQVQAGEHSLAVAEEALDGAGSPWLVPPVADKLGELRSKLAALGSDEAEVGLVSRELPGLLGANGTRKYLLVVQDPVELRGAGGVIGDYGILTTDNGRLSLSQFAPITALYPTHPITITGPAAAWAKAENFSPQIYPQDATFAPDFPTDAQALEQIYAQVTGSKVDGVISVDPEVLADVAGITGPVSVPDWPVPLGATNLIPVLLHDQYTALSGQARQDFLDSVTRAIFERLTSTGLSSPLSLAHALEPAVGTGDLLFYSGQPAEQQLFSSLGATGAMPPVQGDFLEVVTQNAGEDKIDWFLRRSVSYNVAYDPTTGSVTAAATITLVNNAPSSGQPAYVIGGGPGSPVSPGVNQLFISVYTPLLSAGATLNGMPLLTSSQLEKGRHVYSQFVSIPPGGTATVEIHLVGTITGGSTYHLEVAHQPTFVPDQLLVSVHPSSGWTAAGSPALEGLASASGAAEGGGPTSADQGFSVKLVRSN